jgi:choline-glycine betaine transporter
MNLLRIVNAFYAALFLVMALVSVAFLSATLNDRGATSPDAWVPAGWALLFLLYAILAFLNMRRGAAERGKDRLLALNAAAAVPMAAGLVAAEPAGRFLCGVVLIPFALSAAMLLMKRGGNPA